MESPPDRVFNGVSMALRGNKGDEIGVSGMIFRSGLAL